jgi:hypothetical protein
MGRTSFNIIESSGSLEAALSAEMKHLAPDCGDGCGDKVCRRVTFHRLSTKMADFNVDIDPQAPVSAVAAAIMMS